MPVNNVSTTAYASSGINSNEIAQKAGYADFEAMSTDVFKGTNIKASMFESGYTVTYGDFEWWPVYVTENNGDVVLTLWMVDSIGDYPFSDGWAADGATADTSPHCYQYSWIRAALNMGHTAEGYYLSYFWNSQTGKSSQTERNNDEEPLYFSGVSPTEFDLLFDLLNDENIIPGGGYNDYVWLPTLTQVTSSYGNTWGCTSIQWGSAGVSSWTQSGGGSQSDGQIVNVGGEFSGMERTNVLHGIRPAIDIKLASAPSAEPSDIEKTYKGSAYGLEDIVGDWYKEDRMTVELPDKDMIAAGIYRIKVTSTIVFDGTPDESLGEDDKTRYFTVTIKKANPNVAEGSKADSYNADSMPDLSTILLAKNPVSGIAVAGTYTYDGDPSPTAGATKSYAWTFTPTDTDNYEIVTGTVSLTFVKAEDPDPDDTKDPDNPGGGGTTDPTDPDNPGGGGTTDPTDPNNPGGSGTTDPNNPGGSGTTDPTDPNNPGGSGTTDPTDPDNPGGGSGTTDPTDPNNPGGGSGTTDPTDPNNPGGGGTTDPNNPDNPDGSGTTDPTDPDNPGGSGTTDPTDPDNPGGSGTTDPTDPNNPGGGGTTDPDGNTDGNIESDNNNGIVAVWNNVKEVMSKPFLGLPLWSWLLIGLALLILLIIIIVAIAKRKKKEEPAKKVVETVVKEIQPQPQMVGTASMTAAQPVVQPVVQQMPQPIIQQVPDNSAIMRLEAELAEMRAKLANAQQSGAPVQAANFDGAAMLRLEAELAELRAKQSGASAAQPVQQVYDGGAIARIEAELSALREEQKSRTEAELANAKLLVEFERLRGDVRQLGGAVNFGGQQNGVHNTAIPADVVIALLEAVKNGNAPVSLTGAPAAIPQIVEESPSQPVMAQYPSDAVITTTTTVDRTKPLRESKRDKRAKSGSDFTDVDGFYDEI